MIYDLVDIFNRHDSNLAEWKQQRMELDGVYEDEEELTHHLYSNDEYLGDQ